jgi:hypothetical protein
MAKPGIDISPETLETLFNNDEACLSFLASLKWSEGFTCKKCGNTNYCHGKTPYSRRCTRCKTEESATTGTIFHNCKFPVSKAFYIAFNLCKGGVNLSTYEYARRLSLRQMTCWKFRTKVLNAMTDAELQPESENLSLKKFLCG